MGMESQDYALRFRDVVTAVAQNVVDRMRPEPKLAKVYSINGSAGKCEVLFAGEVYPNTITVKMGSNLIPTVSMDTNFGTLGMEAPGDIVRVAGRPGAYYIDSFVSGAPLTTLDKLNDVQVAAPANGDLLRYDAASSQWKPAKFGLLSRWTGQQNLAGSGAGPGAVDNTYYLFSAIPIPAGVSWGQFHFGNHARSGANAAGYWSMFILRSRTGVYELIVPQQRVHNDTDPSTDLGIALTGIADLRLDGTYTCNIAINLSVDAGGNAFTLHPGHLEAAFFGCGKCILTVVGAFTAYRHA